MVERRLAKAKVAGPNPVFRSNKKADLKVVCFLRLLVISMVLCYNVLVESGIRKSLIHIGI